MKKETLGKTLKDLEDLDENEDDIMTFFVLDSINDDDMPIVYVIPLKKQLEVEKLAKSIVTENFDDAEYEFERLLRRNGINSELIGIIDSVTNRQKDWIDDKVPRVIVG